jgi:hypothetical protein
MTKTQEWNHLNICDVHGNVIGTVDYASHGWGARCAMEDDPYKRQGLDAIGRNQPGPCTWTASPATGPDGMTGTSASGAVWALENHIEARHD